MTRKTRKPRATTADFREWEANVLSSLRAGKPFTIAADLAPKAYPNSKSVMDPPRVRARIRNIANREGLSFSSKSRGNYLFITPLVEEVVPSFAKIPPGTPVKIKTLPVKRGGVSYKKTTYVGEKKKGENKDCAVRALMTVTGISYQEAHSLLAKHCGRKDKKGTNTNRLIALLDNIRVIKTLGFTATRVHSSHREVNPLGRRRQMGTVTLRSFIQANPKGTFFVLKRSHAFAVVDGVVIDTWEPGGRCKVTYAWKLEPLAQAQPEVVEPAPAPKKTPIRFRKKTAPTLAPQSLKEKAKALSREKGATFGSVAQALGITASHAVHLIHS